MTEYREILRMHSQGISQRGIAASCTCSRNTVATVLRQAEEKGIAWPLEEKMTDAVLHRLLASEEALPALRKQPDYEQVHREMSRSGVTLTLLWDEYCQTCREQNETPFMYTQFCFHYREHVLKTKATMHIHRKPGEQMEVDWAGQTAEIISTDTSEILPAYIFVAVLSCSQYAYVEAFMAQDLECWVAAHVHAFSFFGGVTRILVPDNLKTGVETPSRYTPVINRTYHELAEHYGVAVIPARVRRPKDKPNAEGTVGVISTWIVAALRNQRFFSVVELNQAIGEKLREFNEKPFQKKPGSRASAFHDEEKAFLQPLPPAPYELATWKIATVQFNYHVAVLGMYYSVPYEYIKHKVDIRLARLTVEVFFQGSRICSHPRLYGRDGQYSTVTEHMPEEHKKYTQWNAKRFLSWAESIGPHTASVVRAILAAHKVEQQGYRGCMALLKSTEKYTAAQVEQACQNALSYTPTPSYKSVQTLLKSGNAKPVIKPESHDADAYGFTRGADYYGQHRGHSDDANPSPNVTDSSQGGEG